MRVITPKEEAETEYVKNPNIMFVKCFKIRDRNLIIIKDCNRRY